MTSPDNRAAHAGHPGSPAGATTTDAPPSSTRRLPALDVLRGIAILGTLLIYLGIAAFLIAFSALWLRRFPRGPVELVWHWSYEAICAGLDRRKARKAAKEEPTADTGAREGNSPGAPVPATGTGTGTEPEPGAPANPRG